MVHQIQADFKSNRLAAVILSVIVGLGLACWFQAISSRSQPRDRTPERSQISVLPDPFEKS